MKHKPIINKTLTQQQSTQLIRPSSGGSYQGGARGLDQLSSPMRSRVEIVARKSDHICVVRDVPDMRGSWYQQRSSHQQSSAQSSYSQQSMGGSLDQPGTPGQGQQQPGQQQQQTPSTSAAGSSAPAKPSFAALFGKHPAITEEPTTPGGTLASETPPPGSGLGGLAGRRSPFNKLHATASSPTPTASQAAASLSQEHTNQIIRLLNELKTDLKQDMTQLTKRVDLMDASVSKVTQTVSKLQVVWVPSEGSRKLAEHGKESDPKLAGPSSSATLRPGEESSSTSKSRDRSKSPSKHHHHHHHHHHRKASHATPSITPTASQADLSSANQSAMLKAGPGIGDTLAVITKSVALGEPTSSSSAMAPATTLSLQQQTRPVGKGGSFEQSDDDQDATSKL